MPASPRPDTSSILSHGEREIASLLRTGYSVEEIADERDQPVPAVEKAVARVREKTDRALATLLQSPFTEDALADLDPDSRDVLLARLDE